jgi:hypothetical protein
VHPVGSYCAEIVVFVQFVSLDVVGEIVVFVQFVSFDVVGKATAGKGC